VGTDFDSLLAKFVVRGGGFEETTQEARRVMRELNLSRGGTMVRTNAAVLAGVLEHPDWSTGDIDTLWLERNAVAILELGNKAVGLRVVRRGLDLQPGGPTSTTAPAAGGGGPTTTMLQPGPRRTLTLSPPGQKDLETKQTLTLSSIGRKEAVRIDIHCNL
jgi:hypothetical protein